MNVVSSKQKKERKRSIPEFLSRTNSLPAFESLPRRTKTERTKTSPHNTTGTNIEMSTLRTSVHQTIGIGIHSSDEEDQTPTSKIYDNTSILELTKNTIQYIRVIHRKREKSDVPNQIPDPSNSDSHSEFEWELALTFDANLDHLTNASLSIVDVATPEDISIEKREELLKAISPFTSRDFPYVIVWKGIQRHNIYKDFHQLVTICEVMDGDGNKVCKPF